MQVRSVTAPEDHGVYSDTAKQLEKNGLWAGWQYFYMDKDGREISDAAAAELLQEGYKLEEVV